MPAVPHPIDRSVITAQTKLLRVTVSDAEERHAAFVLTSFARLLASLRSAFSFSLFSCSKTNKNQTINATGVDADHAPRPGVSECKRNVTPERSEHQSDKGMR